MLSWQFHHGDRAHLLKNHAAARFGRVQRLRMRRRLLLSGTPIQNDLRELLALLCVVMPRVFCRADGSVQDAVMDLFAARGDAGGKGGKDARTLARVRRIMVPFVKRRLKRDVASELVPKTSRVVTVDPTPSQRELYDG